MTEPSTTAPPSASSFESILRCVECGGELRATDDAALSCAECGIDYPVERGTPRMLPRRIQRVGGRDDPEVSVKESTAASFAYEWAAFGRPRPEWRMNFADYMRPHPPGFFDGISVLDIGAGSGRHAREATRLGAHVTAVDLGDSIDTARANLPEQVMTVQADAESLPFAPKSFDFVMAIGVLHHLPDTERALRRIARFARPGGRVHVYLYWQPERTSHRLILNGVELLRRITIRMPHRLLHALCYPLSAALWISIVLPYRFLRRFPKLERVADAVPLKVYADYPLGVLVNDQFDRFSAPIERRFTREEVEALMRAAGLEDVVVLPHHGWIADGKRPMRTEALPAPARPKALAEAPEPAAPVTRLAAVASQSPDYPGFRVRVLLLCRELERLGVLVEPLPLFEVEEARRIRDGSLRDRAALVSSARKRLLRLLESREGEFDTTLIQRQVDVLPSLRLERAAVNGRRLIWDVDDAIWHDTAREAGRHPLAVLKGTRRKVGWLAERADKVLAGNRILAERLGELNDNVTIVPSLVETRDVVVREHRDQDTITLGWIGSASTARYLSAARDALTQLARLRQPKSVKLLVVGGGIERVDGVEVEHLDWSVEAERKALARIDIGLMPMPDNDWTRGKCAYKALQYMAAGIPAVADDVGVAREVIGSSGVTVAGSDEWVVALDELADDASLRSRIGIAGRRRVEEEFSVQRWAPVLASIVRGEGSSGHVG